MAETKFNKVYQDQVNRKRKVSIPLQFREGIPNLIIYQIPIKGGVKCYPSDVYHGLVMEFNFKKPRPNPEHAHLFKQTKMDLINSLGQLELHDESKIKPLETVVISGHGDYFTITPKSQNSA